MHIITFISTVHVESGKCNEDELFEILKIIKPDVVFLEALESTYSPYEQHNFKNFGVYHNKLEIAAIQKYNELQPLIYVPVLNEGLSDAFDKKYSNITPTVELESLFGSHQNRIQMEGFQYINSAECTLNNERLRVIERNILNDDELEQSFKKSIEEYENSMMRNIYTYCKSNPFDKGVFMCGVAHRNSIINKIKTFNEIEGTKINWKIYGS